MVKPRHLMSSAEWRLDTDSRISELERHKAIQIRVWWGVATAVGGFLLPRFIDFVINGAFAVGATP